MSLKTQLLCLVALILCPILVYFNSLKGAFQFDDVDLLTQYWVSDLNTFNKNVGFIFTKDGQFGLKLINSRPFLLLTFALNNHLHQNQVFGFHLTNLLIHIFVTILIFAILRQSQRFLYAFSGDTGPNGAGSITGRDQEDPPAYAAFALPLTAALLFSAHPLATSAVSYISSRSSILGTFFYLLSLYFSLRIFLVAGNKHCLQQRVFWGVLALLAFYLGLASKMTAATLPVMLAVWFYFIVDFRAFPGFRSLLFGRKMLAIYGACFLFLIVYVVKNFQHDKGLELYGRIPYLLVQSKVILFYYLKLFLFPMNLNIDVGYAFTTFLQDFRIPVSILVLLGSVSGVLVLGGPFLKAAALWFFLTLAPTSSLVPLNDLAVEHRLYLPMSLGLCVVASLAIMRMAAVCKLRFLALLITLLASLTAAQNLVWRTEFSLWENSLEKSPHFARPYNNLGKAYSEKGETERSVDYFKKSIELAPHFPDAHYNIANVYMDLRRMEDSEREYEKALKLNPLYFAAYLGLGSIYNQTGRYPQAVEIYQKAIQARLATRDLDYPMARLNLGEVYGKMERYKEAIEELKRAVELSPGMYKAHYNLGLAYMKSGDPVRAEFAYLESLRLNPEFENALFNLAHLYQMKRKWEDAIKIFERFLQIKKADPKACFGIGFSYHNLGQFEKSREFYEKAIEVQPDYWNARLNLAGLYIQYGQFDPALQQLEMALRTQPDMYNVHVQIAIIFKQFKKDAQKALEHLRMALSLNPPSPYKEQISQMILEWSGS